MFNLKVIHGKHAGAELQVHDSSVTIGRASHCNLYLGQDGHVSRVHGEFFTSGRSAWYSDLQSHNGSKIRKQNGSFLTLSAFFPKCEIKTGDRVYLGESVVEVISAGRDIEEVSGFTVSQELPDDSQLVTISPSNARSSTEDSLRQFLELPKFNVADAHQAKRALCNAFLNMFPAANCMSIVAINPKKRKTLTPDDIIDEETAIQSRDEQSHAGYSFAILAETFRRRETVSFQPPLPSSESVQQLSMGSCLCGPVFDGDDIVAFVQIHGMGRAAFGTHDLQLFGILTSVTALLLRQARATAEREKWRRFASVGQAIASLSHDVRSILGSVGSFADKLEDDVPTLASNKRWGYIRQDLDLMKFLVKDTRIRLQGSADLTPERIELNTQVQPILDACQRYFVNDADRDRVAVVNMCNADHVVFAHPNALWIAVMNCVKNGVDAYLSRNANDGPLSPRQLTPQAPTQLELSKTAILRKPEEASPSEVIVTSCDDPSNPEEYCLLNICDAAGGIPDQILPRMGKEFVSTKGDRGTGLGFQIVADSMARLHGEVIVATTTSPSAEFHAGTVISLKLPKSAPENGKDVSPDPFIVDDPIAHFSTVYSQIKRKA